MNRRNQTPPVVNTPNGGDSEKSQLNWVLQSQSQLNQTVGELASDSKHFSESIKRIEDRQHDLLAKIEANQCALLTKIEANQTVLVSKSEVNSASIIKINTKLIVFIAILTTAGAVGGAFLNGQVTKAFGSMQEMAEAQTKDNKK